MGGGSVKKLRRKIISKIINIVSYVLKVDVYILFQVIKLACMYMS